jgi:hypothetical protein
MYLADSIGYLGYVAVLVGRQLAAPEREFLPFYFSACWLIAALSLISLVTSWAWFASRVNRPLGESVP